MESKPFGRTGASGDAQAAAQNEKTTSATTATSPMTTGATANHQSTTPSQAVPSTTTSPSPYPADRTTLKTPHDLAADRTRSLSNGTPTRAKVGATDPTASSRDRSLVASSSGLSHSLSHSSSGADVVSLRFALSDEITRGSEMGVDLGFVDGQEAYKGKGKGKGKARDEPKHFVRSGPVLGSGLKEVSEEDGGTWFEIG